jgi:hypothetical protein
MSLSVVSCKYRSSLERKHWFFREGREIGRDQLWLADFCPGFKGSGSSLVQARLFSTIIDPLCLEADPERPFCGMSAP